MIDFDYAVIGKGLWGSSAARHLSGKSDSVVLIGPDEPADPTSHEGVYSSHYDQGRLTRRIASNRVWAETTAQTFRAMAELESATGATLLRPVGSLTVSSAAVTPRHGRQSVVDVPGGPVDSTVYEAGDDSWRHRFPEFDFPSDCRIVHEGPPSGVLDPRALVIAQTQVALDQGAEVVNDFVLSAEEDEEGVSVLLSSGAIIRCGKVLVATGAFTNHFDLLPRRLSIAVETETYILGTVSDEVGRRLSTIPTMHYTIDDPDIADVYMTPPLVYPDGLWKVKMGANTSADSSPQSLEEITEWFQRGDTDAVRPALQRAMQSILPSVEFVGFETGACILAMTDNDHPVLDQVTDRLFVAVAGNGTGAKSSDGWGQLASQLMLDEPWPDWADRSYLAAR